MRILHYALGLPPYRQNGGLTKYVQDLINHQSKTHQVFLLYAAGVSVPFKTLKVREEKKYPHFRLFRIENSIPVSLFYGIKDYSIIDDSNMDLSRFNEFLKEINPEIIHIHSCMGLGINIMQCLKNSGASLIFTSHDFFGLCTKVNLIDSNRNFCVQRDPLNCSRCNATSPGSAFLRIRNSPILNSLKKYLPRKSILKTTQKMQDHSLLKNKNEKEYCKILRSYERIFSLIDAFHFNSDLTAAIYKSYLPEIKRSKVIPITHGGIKDRRKIKQFGGIVRLTHIGGIMPHKGLPILLDVLEDLYQSGYRNWQLNIWGSEVEPIFSDALPIKSNGIYSQDQLKLIYDSTDLLIVPSICPETFNFGALEALSFGVPILLSSNVGAKCLLKTIDDNFIYSNDSELKEKLLLVLNNIHILETYNKKICDAVIQFDIEQHSDEILDYYTEVIRLK